MPSKLLLEDAIKNVNIKTCKTNFRLQYEVTRTDCHRTAWKEKAWSNGNGRTGGGGGEGRVLGGEGLHGEELHCLYSSPSAVKVTQLSDITHVARVGRMKMHTKFYLET